jgi:hypothetical protein
MSDFNWVFDPPTLYVGVKFIINEHSCNTVNEVPIPEGVEIILEITSVSNDDVVFKVLVDTIDNEEIGRTLEVKFSRASELIEENYWLPY